MKVRIVLRLIEIRIGLHRDHAGYMVSMKVRIGCL